MPKNWTMIPRETVEKAYRLAEGGGMGYTAIARQLGVSPHAVTKWLKDPAHHSPFIDEVAIERALLGERQVYDNLSRFEVKEFWSRVREQARIDLENHASPGDNPEIYSRLAKSWDTTTMRVRNHAQKAG